MTLKHPPVKVLKLEMKEKELMRLRGVAAGSAFSSRDESFKAIFTHRFMELKLALTRCGEAFHTRGCRFANAPHTHTKKVMRACRECMLDAVRGVLNSIGGDGQHRS